MTALFDAPAVLRRATPTAHLVMPASAGRDAWLRARKGGLGSSDIAAAMGVTEYSTPLHIYYNKRGELPDNEDAGEAALWGTLHEDTVAREWARRNKSAIRRVGLVAQTDAPWRMCTLDRRVTVCPLRRDLAETCCLEVKTRSAWVAGKWRKGVPDDVLAQVLWQARVTGYGHVHVALLIGGNDYRQFTVHAAEHGQLIGDITTIADRLWHEHIVEGQPPAATGNPEALIDLYDELNPARGGVARLDRDMAAFDALDEYLEASADEKAAGGRKAAAKAVLVGALGGAEIGVLDDEAAYTYAEASRSSVNTSLLAERWPDAYAVCVTDKSSRRLNITNDYRKKWGNR
jgi:putative phage-type endonuclease